MYRLIPIFVILIKFIFSQNVPYTILVSLDGFRWDYVNRNITPNIDKLINNGVHASSLRPCFPSKTFPNHQSIITGMYPENHGIIANSFIDPISERWYTIGDTSEIRKSKWYLGEAFWETAERQGIKTASYFWPGSEIKYKERRASYYNYYEHDKPYRQRIDELIEWLKLPQKDRPRFCTLYFHDTDDYGHDYGPTSTEINQSVSRVDSLIGYLTESLYEIGIGDSTNVIIVSDHGMTEISNEKVIFLNEIIDVKSNRVIGSGPFAFIDPNGDKTTYEKLKDNEKHFKVYNKENIPSYFRFSKHPFIPELVLVAEMGWSILKDSSSSDWYLTTAKGNHGYDNNHLDMHGLFVANGPSFKKGYKTGSLWNIDIYPLLCKIYGIYPRNNIDGKSERIEFILDKK